MHVTARGQHVDRVGLAASARQGCYSGGAAEAGEKAAYVVDVEVRLEHASVSQMRT